MYVTWVNTSCSQEPGCFWVSVVVLAKEKLGLGRWSVHIVCGQGVHFCSDRVPDWLFPVGSGDFHWLRCFPCFRYS